MKKIQTTDNQGNEIVSLAMTQFKTNDASKSCKDGRCITVSVAERNLRRQEKDNIALAGLSGRVSVYTVSSATLAYGYAHCTPAALTKHQRRHCEVRSNPDFNYSEFAIIKMQSRCVLRRLKSAVNKVSSLRDWLGRVA